jgi:hypothetical protein
MGVQAISILVRGSAGEGVVTIGEIQAISHRWLKQAGALACI